MGGGFVKRVRRAIYPGWMEMTRHRWLRENHTDRLSYFVLACQQANLSSLVDEIHV